MSYNVNLDYSTLLGSTSSSSSSSSYAFDGISLSDYASLKNGSYYQLSKAYYEKNSSEDSSSESDSKTTNALVRSSAVSLVKSANELTSSGSSLFEKQEITTTDENGEETTTTDYDKDAIYKAVSQFVSDYNDLITSTGNSSSTSITRESTAISDTVAAHSRLLAEAGITINSDNTLSVNEDSLKAADISTLKTLFSGQDSLAANLSSQAYQIHSTAESEAKKNGTYTSEGTYSSTSFSSIIDTYT